MDHPLAHKDGPALLMALLFYQGAMCPKCGHGTRVTSKRWAKCKKCGEKVERRELPKVDPQTKRPDLANGAGPRR